MSTTLPQQSASLPARKRVSPLVFIFLTIFIDLLGVGLLQPVLPFLVQKFRPDALTIGLLASTFSVAQFLAAPVLGAISDRYGRRPVLLFSMFGTAVGYFIFGFATALWLLFVSRLIDGATGAVVSSAQAYIADVSAPEDRTKNFGLVGAALGLGFIFGPAIGGFLGHFNLNWPVFFAGTCALLNTALGYFTLTESLAPENRRQLSRADLNPFRQLLGLFRDPRVRLLVTGFLLFNIAFAGFTGFFAVFLRDRFHWGPAEAAGLFACIGIALATVQGGLIRRLVPRFGEAKLVQYGLMIAMTAFLIVPLIQDAKWLYGTQVLLALGVGIAIPSLRGLVSNSVTGREQGKTIGGTQGLTSLSQMLGPLWATAAFDYLGAYTPFWIAIGLIAIALGFLMPGLRQREPA